MHKHTQPADPADMTYSFATIATHPLVRKFQLTRRMAERAYYRGALIGYKPGGYVQFTDENIREWIEASRSDRKGRK